MFTVECPGCSATYQVDERRVPAGGLRMRCPKCSTAFVVEKPTTGQNAAIDADLPAQVAKPAVPQPARPPGPSRPLGGPPGPPPRPAAPQVTLPAVKEAKPIAAAGPVAAQKLPPRPLAAGSALRSVGTPGLPNVGDGLASPLSSTVDDLLPTAVPHGGKPGDARPPVPQRPPPQARAGAALGAPEIVAEPALVAPKRSPAERVQFEAKARAPSVESAARLASDDLPAPVSLRNQPTEPTLPIAPNLGGYDSDSELPAALGSKPVVAGSPRGLGERHATQPRLENFRDLELDLPRLATARRADERGDFAGLPEVAAPRRHSPTGIELDLPSPSGHERNAPRAKPKSVPPPVDDFEFELPSPVQARNESDAEFPQLRQSPFVPEGGELPEVRRYSNSDAVGLPAIDAGLPAISTSNLGLPSLPGASGAMTKTLSGTGTPPPMGRDSVPPMATSIPPADIPELDLGWGAGPSVPPSGGRAFESSLGSLPPAFGVGSSSLSIPPALGGGASTVASSADSFPPLSAGEMVLPVESARLVQRKAAASVPPGFGLESQSNASAAGSSSYGEVSLDSSDDVLAVETETGVGRQSLTSSEGLEFGALPLGSGDVAVRVGEAAPAAMTAPVSLRKGPAQRSVAAPVGSRKSRRVLYAVLSLVAVGGSALSLLPDIGLFGANLIVDQVKRKDNLALVQRQADAGRAVLVRDDFSGVSEVIQRIESTRHEHERLKLLAAYFAYFSYVVELRHGGQSAPLARAQVTLNELGERPDLAFWGLAQAARAAVEGNLARARRNVEITMSREPRNVDAVALLAELLLLERRAGEALQQWQAAEKLESSARTAFGLSRANYALGQFDEATNLARLTMQRNPRHVGAQLLLARIAIEVRHDTAEAERLIQAVLKLNDAASVSDFVQAKTLSGDVHLIHSRISLAETSYQEAIAKAPKSAAALRGLGETLYRAGRYSESLARFEAGIQADPDNVDSAVGAAKAQLALERIREAGALLARLRQANPKNYAVNYWYARANEAGGNRDEAEKAYGVAIEAGGKDPAVVDAYVGLALVKNQQGRPEEAQKVLAQAQEMLPKVPKIHEAMGQLALAEGRYAAAAEQFKEALALDSSDVGFKFRLGVAYRKNRQFDAAAKCFDEVSVIDRDYPGLALERGQLFESSGQTDEALRAFESALAKAPNDADLMLRVGCGKASAGRPEQAELLLKKVLEQRPTSAETHHCLGRAQLLEGSNLALALRTLERAVELDPHRAEYHLYVGWAANEAGRVAQAEQSLKKALELDQGLGDAYWQRGILRYRQGAIKDAVSDLTRALELRPGRYEAHAALADAYFDLGLEAKALDQWHSATTAQPDNAAWAFRYGKLLQAAHRDVEARAELEKSIELAEKLSGKPRWIWEAHHLLARAIGMQPAAVKHWQSFLELAPRDNVYRVEAEQALIKLGHPWNKE